MSAVVSLTSAQVHLAGRPVLSDVSLTLERGECVALLGANGSGKSTLVRALVGLVPLTCGRLELFGTPVERFREWPRLGYVPQRVTAVPGVPANVGEVVLSGRLPRMRRLRRASDADRCAVECALETVGLVDRARDPVASLSGGQQQRVLIARALAGDPEVLLLDEPTSAIDLPGQRAFAATLAALVESGLAVLLVAHELGPLASVVQRRVVLRDGRVVTDGDADAAPDHAHHLEPEPLSTGPRLA